MRVRLLICAALLGPLIAVPTPAAAAGPGSGGTPTGIAPDTGGDPGYTSEYAQAKQALFDSWVAARNAALNPTYASNSLTNWTSYHQKQSWYCLPAVGQSILKYNFGSAYISPSVGTKQASIAYAMGTTRLGTSNTTALSYVNGQFATNNSGFRYVTSTPISATDFTNQMAFDIDYWH